MKPFSNRMLTGVLGLLVVTLVGCGGNTVPLHSDEIKPLWKDKYTPIQSGVGWPTGTTTVIDDTMRNAEKVIILKIDSTHREFAFPGESGGTLFHGHQITGAVVSSNALFAKAFSKNLADTITPVVPSTEWNPNYGVRIFADCKGCPGNIDILIDTSVRSMTILTTEEKRFCGVNTDLGDKFNTLGIQSVAPE